VLQTDGDLADACRAAEIGKDLSKGATESYEQAESKQMIGNLVRGGQWFHQSLIGGFLKELIRL
jgi:hypothetical protein